MDVLQPYEAADAEAQGVPERLAERRTQFRLSGFIDGTAAMPDPEARVEVFKIAQKKTLYENERQACLAAALVFAESNDPSRGDVFQAERSGLFQVYLDAGLTRDESRDHIVHEYLRVAAVVAEQIARRDFEDSGDITRAAISRARNVWEEKIEVREVEQVERNLADYAKNLASNPDDRGLLFVDRVVDARNAGAPDLERFGLFLITLNAAEDWSERRSLVGAAQLLVSSDDERVGIWEIYLRRYQGDLESTQFLQVQEWLRNKDLQRLTQLTYVSPAAREAMAALAARRAAEEAGPQA